MANLVKYDLRLALLQVRVGTEGSCAQYGMVAEEDIEKGEMLFEIPRDLLLTPANSAIASILQGGRVLHASHTCNCKA